MEAWIIKNIPVFMSVSPDDAVRSAVWMVGMIVVGIFVLKMMPIGTTDPDSSAATFDRYSYAGGFASIAIGILIGLLGFAPLLFVLKWIAIFAGIAFAGYTVFTSARRFWKLMKPARSSESRSSTNSSKSISQ